MLNLLRNTKNILDVVLIPNFYGISFIQWLHYVLHPSFLGLSVGFSSRSSQFSSFLTHLFSKAHWEARCDWWLEDLPLIASFELSLQKGHGWFFRRVDIQRWFSFTSVQKTTIALNMQMDENFIFSHLIA